ncbi:MAG: DUF3303 domain-containing protein [Deltaproteobacteria bacterium]|nr:DUF3303 domain-containing protein [Deltaproteobacteria bacterium]
MLYMVIEKFKDGNVRQIYQRFNERGRMAPEGLKYIDSWVDAEVTRCFQLMECEDSGLLEKWIDNWNDLVDFEIIQVMSSEQAKKNVLG